MNKSVTLQHETIVSVSDLLNESRLTIPEYQRPYKWTQRNIASLFNDIKTQSDKPAYRLGTIVLHQSKDNAGNDVLNIVDGQQRTLTLILTVMAIIKKYINSPKDKSDVSKILGELVHSVPALAQKQAFASDISIYNLHTNFQEIQRIVNRGELSVHHIDFLMHKCEVVIFILEDESEAFQFFDSQNSRGKALYPHDLLKAFHLREFSAYDERLNPNIKAQTVAHWESLADSDLHRLFGQHLFRIKRWIDHKPARSFSSRHVDIFKGVSLHKQNLPHYAKSMLVLHHFIDDYNGNMHRHIDAQAMSYPFQLDQQLINGRRFFEMIEHYDTLITHNRTIDADRTSDNKNDLLLTTIAEQHLDERASKIIHLLTTYNGRERQGDKYARNLFDNALIYYIDKFGMQDLSQVIETVFIWAYKIRLERYAVKLATMDNRAVNGMLFKRIKEATLPKQVWLAGVSPLKASDIQASNKTPDNAIYKMFNDLNYLADK
ncbi:MAG: DUF262 domain-containing protein [Psychrobacter pacificensis]|jgi:hypothetical protein|uniref:DUF262 domain-containing protein n=1 Tax=Psychrobacter pacificensis TaxID=112002 RepID=UPI0023A3C092|nr:DUF262 domain-containing protein [Psychrobacter pacificensis]MDE0843923.1 DUF262 domain-containing protein [Psychrobacter pacificensis]